MSESGKSVPEKGSVKSLTDRFRRLTRKGNKSELKESDMGSPVSPLRPRASSGITPTSSSSSSSGSVVSGKTGNTDNKNKDVKRSPDAGGVSVDKSNSGELSGSSESSPKATGSVRSVPGSSTTRNPKQGRVRFDSSVRGGSSSSGGGSSGGGNVGSSVNSPTVNVLPAGNICPSGRVLRTGMACKTSPGSDVLGLGTGNYGHGSIMRGGAGVKPAAYDESKIIKKGIESSDPEEVRRAGNEVYKRGHFAEALHLYNRAISMSPRNAAYRSNKAAALIGLDRLSEAVKECEEALRLDPGYDRAHQRLASLYLRLGQVENARSHICFAGEQPDPSELQKLLEVERHLSKCANARTIGDWKNVLREGDAAIAAGADSSPQLFACRTEALLKLHQLKEADNSMSNIPKSEPTPVSGSKTKFFGMLSECYICLVRAQFEMAFGRFENAVEAAEKAVQIEPKTVEATVLLKNVKSVAKARSLGNDLFKSGKFFEACTAYSDGLKIDPSNSVLYCNRAACWSKLEQWKKSVEDCNQTLRLQPDYTKALLRRAASYGKLGLWVESVRDYEVLRRELPGNNEVAEALFHAEVALKKSRGHEIHNLKFGGEVEEISDVDQFRAAISSPSVSVVHFKEASNQQCDQMSPYFDTLCAQYPTLNFIKVDIKESPAIADGENVSIVPTFKIYKIGRRVKEMICPTRQVLENSVRHYSL